MKFKYICLLTIPLFFTSCDKFLDVKPAREVSSDDLLQERKGFESALAGLYYEMSLNTLYGADLTFGVIDVLAGYWNMSTVDHQYYRLINYDYTSMESTVTKYWAPMYKIIFNANNIIDKLSSKQSLNENEKLILGEAIGVRAFLHLDLFRLYGPVVSQEGLQVKSIPYRKKADAVITPSISAGDFLQAVIDDLSTAANLLSEDPIIVNGGVANGNESGGLDYNSLLDRRRVRFNIHAATGLLARTYQLLGNHDKAREYAMQTLNNTDASFVKPTDLSVSGSADTRLTKEIVFGLYIRNHYDNSREIFGIDGSNVAPSRSLVANYDNVQDFIYTKSGDYRLTRWFQNALNYYVFTRYGKPPEVLNEQFLAYRPEVSLISISELYLIIAESYLESDPTESVTYINTLLTNRGVNTPIDPDNATSVTALQELVGEARRQYFGEGQLFYLLKRLFQDIEVSTTVKTPASLGIYKLPISTKELEFNN